MKKLGIFLLLLLVVGCTSQKSEEDFTSELKLLAIELQLSSDTIEQGNLISAIDGSEEEISFKNNTCTSISETELQCTNNQILKFKMPGIKLKDISIKYDDKSFLYYIEATVDGQKYYYDYTEK